MKRLVPAIAFAMLALAAPDAGAHDFNPGVLALVETSEGRFQIAWTPPVDSTGSELPVELRFPAGCRRDGDTVDCGGSGLVGSIAFEHLDSPRQKVVVHVRWLDGGESEQLVDGGDPRLAIERRPGRALLPWIRLGVEHILGGADHLAFLLGMLLVLNLTLDRRLIATITAFTAAHSLSLALAALDVVRLPGPPVEAAIAASVVLVAREALGDRPTATRRWPWLVAGVFGLVHGLGFAGALARIGLPPGAVGTSLLGFNLGVEAGQLAVVLVAVALARAVGLRRGDSVLERDRRAGRAQRGMAYVLGSLGTAWFLAQTALLLGV
jgi:hypothetical protein